MTDQQKDAVYAAYLGICVLQTMTRKVGLKLALSRCETLMADLSEAFPFIAERVALSALRGPSVPSTHQSAPAQSAAHNSGSPGSDASGDAGADTWPNGCRDPESCARHLACMYTQCSRSDKDGNDVAEEIRASSLSATEGK